MLLTQLLVWGGAARAEGPEPAGDASTTGQPDGAAPAGPAPAPAEPTSDAPNSTTGLSPGDLAAIEAALASDAAAASPPPAPPAPLGALSLQSLNPDIAFIGDVAFAYFTADEPLQAGGHDPTANGFTLQQLELSVSKSVDPYFRFDGNIVFSLFGVEVEEAYATTLALPGRVQIRAGQMLTRFGRINNTHPHSWDFVDQAFPVGRVFGGEGNRGLGVEASWLAPTPWFVEVVGSATSAAGESTARSFYGAQDLGFESPLDLQGTLAVKQFFPMGPAWSLSWGLSAANGPNPTGIGNRTDVFGTDVYLRYRPVTAGAFTVVTLQSEWFYRRRQVPGDVWSDVNGYTQAHWRFQPRWGVGARWEYGGAATGLDGQGVDDTLDPDWTAARHRATAALTFWPTEFSRLRAQGAADLVGWREKTDYSAMLAFEFNVGAHGAHAF
jgi:hypothetical protein